MKRLYVNGNLVDLPSSNMGISKQTFDITQPGKRFLDMSTGFTLPYTSKNKNIFGFVDRPGINLTNIRGTQSAALYFDAFKVFSQGTLISKAAQNGYQCFIKGGNEVVKVWEAYSVEDALDLDSNIGVQISTIYATAINSLIANWNGWLLPALRYTEADYNPMILYDYNTGVESELWYNLSTLIQNVITDSGIAVKVLQDGSFLSWSGCNIEGIADDYYFPAWKYRLYTASKASPSWLVRKETSGTRYMGASTMEYTEINTGLGGRNMWEILKLVSTLFAHGIYVDDIADEIILFPLSEIGYNTVNLSGRIIKDSRNFNINGYENNNRIRYKDIKETKLDKNYLSRLITQSIQWLSDTEKNLFTYDMFYTDRDSPNIIFFGNYIEEEELRETPFFGYDDTTTVSRTARYIFDATQTWDRTVAHKKLNYYDNSAYYDELENYVQEGILYDVEIAINLFELISLKPWTTIRIDELGGSFYLNKLNSFDPYNNATAKAQLIKLP